MSRRDTAEHHRHGEAPEPHDLGLSHDLPTLLTRRRALLLLGGAGLAGVAGCTADTGSTATGSTATTEIPEETGGPFPADGSNGPNVLAESGVVRSDITASFGGATGVATGAPVDIVMTVLDVSEGAAPLAGAAVYAWHCDAEGRYSMYDGDVAEENYLRGVQEADADGRVIFRSVFPGAYPGRWPHVHFEVYPSLEAATSAGTRLRTSQLAFPEDACREVYADEATYPGSLSNLEQTSLDTDNVFSDGWSLQLAKVSGSAAAGMTASLTVPV